MKKPRIAITCGDPSGVGPELIQGCLSASFEYEAEITVVGHPSFLQCLSSSAVFPFNAIPVGDTKIEHQPGKPSIAGGKLAIEALEVAAEACKRGDCDAVVTGPISKAWCVKAGFSFPGQTEFFADAWGGEPTMAFSGGKLNVVLATWHIPLMEVSAALNEAVLGRALKRANDLGQRLGFRPPRIGVAGLNPHAGEGGILGSEEKEWIDPFLSRSRGLYPGLSDCVPGDTVFARALNGEFDVVVALYHDQGLAPLKTVDFDRAVNVTLGLPHIRTSPDHGTAFDIAGQGTASHLSFSNAIRLAIRLMS